MTVLELMALNNQYQNFIADRALSGIQRLKLGFNNESCMISNADHIDKILMDKIVSANYNLSKTAEVRIPVWITENDFNSFISKIGMLCN